MSLFIGTSGWAYKEWKPDFYPAGVPQARFLQHYATVFNACEANGTFYKVQPPTTLEKWDSQTPAHFRFVSKVHRGLSYMKQMTPPDEQRRIFFKDFITSLEPLGEKVAALFFQVHPRRKADVEDLQGLIETLPGGIPPLAFDLGDESWRGKGVEEMVAAKGHTVCFSEREGAAPDALPPGPLAYVRLRSQRYEPEAIRAWETLLEREASERDVFVFSKHEGIETSDERGGVGLAQRLARNLIGADGA